MEKKENNSYNKLEIEKVENGYIISQVEELQLEFGYDRSVKQKRVVEKVEELIKLIEDNLLMIKTEYDISKTKKIDEGEKSDNS